MTVVEVGVRLQFAVAGRVVLGEDGRPRFPALPGTAAIYGLDLSGDGEPRVYVGETYNMRRRGNHYRNTGATQQTSIRINDLLVRHLAAGGSVSISVAEAAEIVRDGVSSRSTSPRRPVASSPSMPRWSPRSPTAATCSTSDQADSLCLPFPRTCATPTQPAMPTARCCPTPRHRGRAIRQIVSRLAAAPSRGRSH